MCRRHNLGEAPLSKWKQQVVENVATLFASVSSEICIIRNAPFGIRVFDTYGISTTHLVLTLQNCGPNKRMHFRLLGKTPEYVVFYTDAYQEAMKTERVEQATIGCIIWGGVLAGYYLYSAGQL